MYVLWREDEQAHKMFYVTRDQTTNALMGTADRSRALEFETAREAYEFGEQCGLEQWHAGRR